MFWASHSISHILRDFRDQEPQLTSTWKREAEVYQTPNSMMVTT